MIVPATPITTWSDSATVRELPSSSLANNGADFEGGSTLFSRTNGLDVKAFDREEAIGGVNAEVNEMGCKNCNVHSKALMRLMKEAVVMVLRILDWINCVSVIIV